MSDPATIQRLVQDSTAAYSARDFSRSDRLADEALAIQPGEPNALYIKALARRGLGDTQGAIDSLNGVLAVMPRAHEVHNLLGLCHQDLGDLDAARRAFETSEGYDPKFLHAPFNLARVLFDLGELRAAVAAYERVITPMPDHVHALRGLAHTLLVLREFERAEAIAGQALALGPSDAVALSVKGACLLRSGDAGAAIALIEEQLRPQEGGTMNVALALGVLGEAHEARGEYRKAFDAWSFGNERIRGDVADHYETHEGAYSLAVAQRLRAFFEARQPAADAPQQVGPAPVFLVGFPRSGTTLLENILAAHPAITTSEEKPHADPILDAAGTTTESLTAFMECGPDRLDALRTAYWEGTPDGRPPEPGNVFVDKLPLNLVWMGVLARVFPGAKFLLALRDPRDCVLSAFQQRFVLNPAMFRMLRMSDAATYYDAAFGAAGAARTANPNLSVHEVRYERIVDDLEDEARRIIGFLGLAWTDSVLDYREQASRRAIATPSGPQVDAPVYTASLDRWRNYPFAFDEAVMESLTPWIRRFGYPV